MKGVQSPPKKGPGPAGGPGPGKAAAGPGVAPQNLSGQNIGKTGPKGPVSPPKKENKF